MRRQFVATMSDLMASDARVRVLLCDISAHAFKAVSARFPGRVLNLGVLEQATVGIAAGMAKEGLYPVVHSIAPFLTLRAFEFIRNDFGQQGLAGAFVSVGASFDYGAMGATHHCAEDVAVMSTIPGMNVHVPGNARETDFAIRAAREHRGPSYIRLSEATHREEIPPHNVMVWRHGEPKVGVVSVGPMLSKCREACGDLDDIALCHLTHVYPLPKIAAGYLPSKLLVVEPYYRGFLASQLVEAMPGPVTIRSIGVPPGISEGYGTREDHEEACGLAVPNIRKELEALIG